MALSKIGEVRSQLTDVDIDDTTVSRQCLVHYEQTLHELVRMHSWGCTKERAKLTTVSTSGSEDDYFGWEYYANIPSDCLRPLYLTNTTESQRFLKPQVEWTIESSQILTNFSDSWLLYIKEPTPAVMDSLFAMAFYTLLASKIAVPITGDQQIAQQMLNEFYNVVMPEARRVNSFEGHESPVVDSNWLEATYTSPSNLGSSWPPFGSATWTTTFPWS